MNYDEKSHREYKEKDSININLQTFRPQWFEWNI